MSFGTRFLELVNQSVLSRTWVLLLCVTACGCNVAPSGNPLPLSPTPQAGDSRIMEISGSVLTRHGDGSVDLDITVVNLGNGPLQITAVSTDGVPADKIHLSWNSRSIDAGRAERLLVGIATGVSRPFTLTVSFASNATSGRSTATWSFGP